MIRLLPLVVVVSAAVAGCKNRSTEGDKAPAEGVKPEATAPASLPERLDTALRRGADYVISQQSEDGAFRSKAYAALEGGDSLTPLVLAALRFAATDERHNSAYRRGVDFLSSLELETLSYPVYALAGAVLVLNSPGNERHEQARERYIAAIRDRQLGAGTGWPADDPSFGAWSYHEGIPTYPGPQARPDPRLAGNLSATLFAVGALELGGVKTEDAALVAARGFVESCQNFAEPPGPFDDGGFFFSPAIADSNKAGAAGADADGRARYHSYGSMTADGLRALMRFGLPANHARVVAARTWLERHFDPAHNPGDFAEGSELRGESSYFYYTWSAAHALRASGSAQNQWASRLAEELIRRQRDDGAWANRYGEMREDDPMVATSFALAALAVCRIVLTGEHRSHRRVVE